MESKATGSFSTYLRVYMLVVQTDTCGYSSRWGSSRVLGLHSRYGGVCVADPPCCCGFCWRREDPAAMMGVQLPLACTETLSILDRWQDCVLYEAIFKLHAVEMGIQTFLVNFLLPVLFIFILHSPVFKKKKKTTPKVCDWHFRVKQRVQNFSLTLALQLLKY